MYSGETPNFNLPQYTLTDRFDPMADFNGAFQTIDTQMEANKQAGEDIPTLKQQIADLTAQLATFKTETAANFTTTNNNLIIAKNAADNAMVRAKLSTPEKGTTGKRDTITLPMAKVGATWPWNPSLTTGQHQGNSLISNQFAVNYGANVYPYSFNIGIRTDFTIVGNVNDVLSFEMSIISANGTTIWASQQEALEYTTGGVRYGNINISKFFPLENGNYYMLVGLHDLRTDVWMTGNPGNWSLYIDTVEV